MNSIIVYHVSGCKACLHYNNCKLRLELTAEPSCCQNWSSINNIHSVKTDGKQIHECPCCGYKYWD